MKKIFIIEDDVTFLRLLERIFTVENFEVQVALEGADALAKLYMADDVPSVILLDIMIPVLSGVEVLKLLKQSDKLKNIPVIILSNLTPQKETEQKILALGAKMYLHKSDYTPSQIVAKVVETVKDTALEKPSETKTEEK